MAFKVRYTKGAKKDLIRLYQFLLTQDIKSAKRAYSAIEKMAEFLQEFPFSCTKSQAHNPFLRKAIIPFGSSGYVALFEIENHNTVTILAIRHQRENDYY